MPNNYLACDLGAESGRVMLGEVSSSKLELREVHRFANVAIRNGSSLRWDIPNIVLEVKKGLGKAAATGLKFESISTDSWGVDYLLFNAAGSLISPTFHYRDPRAQAGVEKTFSRVTWPEVFEETGIQFMPINTLYQLATEPPERLEQASFLLGVADGINYFLSGAKKMDVTLASTFQVYNPRTKGWSEKLIHKLELPRRIFPDLVQPGTVLGPLRGKLGEELGLANVPVIATCSHDTAAAVAGIPASGGGWAYISSGTWSLLGLELDQLVITDKCRELNFTNEIGYGGKVRLLKNVSGMWLVQECRRIWQEQGRAFTYGELAELSAGVEPFQAIIDPGAPEFLAPRNMPEEIAEYCRRTSQRVPRTEGEFIRTCYESLAVLYRFTLDQIKEVTGRMIDRLHIVGGGSNNSLLNQFTADATGLPVLAGPAEATAMGNVLVQAITMGKIKSLEEGREIVKNSCGVVKFEPKDRAGWERQYARFVALKEQSR